MVENPLISIIIPCYNRAHLIGETLQSVIDQTYTNWECIVVDDHSTDKSLEIVNSYSRKDSRIKLIERPKHKPKGANACRNYGVQVSKGDFLIFLDSDDLLTSTCLYNRLKVVENFPNLDLWVFSTELFENQPGDKKILINITTEEELLHRFLKFDVVWLTTGPIWKRDIIQRIGLWDENLKSWQDWDLSVRALIEGCKIRYFNKVDNYWRVPTSGSIGPISTSNEHLKSHQYLINKITLLLKEKKMLTHPLEEYLLSIYFWIAKEWINKGKIVPAVLFWLEGTKVTSSLRILMNLLLLVSIRFRQCRPVTNKILEMTNHFSNHAFSSKTFRTVLSLESVESTTY